MTNHPKLQIYQGMIQYLLDSTGYDLKNIATLSNASIKGIRSVYHGDEIPPNFYSSEKHLVQLFQMKRRAKLLDHFFEKLRYKISVYLC